MPLDQGVSPPAHQQTRGGRGFLRTMPGHQPKSFRSQNAHGFCLLEKG